MTLALVSCIILLRRFERSRDEIEVDDATSY